MATFDVIAPKVKQNVWSTQILYEMRIEGKVDNQPIDIILSLENGQMWAIFHALNEAWTEQIYHK